MFLKILLFLGLTVLAGVLYRLGGAGKQGKWYDFIANTKARDFGVPTCLIAIFMIFAWAPHWSMWLLILTWGATFGVQTTYWKKGPDAKWYNWLFTGLGYSVCWLPIVIAQNIPGHVPAGVHSQWLGFFIHLVACTGWTVMVSELIGKDVWEENARGWVQALTVPLLFI